MFFVLCIFVFLYMSKRYNTHCSVCNFHLHKVKQQVLVLCICVFLYMCTRYNAHCSVCNCHLHKVREAGRVFECQVNEVEELGNAKANATD